MSQEKLKTKLIQKFWGKTKGTVEFENSEFDKLTHGPNQSSNIWSYCSQVSVSHTWRIFCDIRSFEVEQ